MGALIWSFQMILKCFKAPAEPRYVSFKAFQKWTKVLLNGMFWNEVLFWSTSLPGVCSQGQGIHRSFRIPGFCTLLTPPALKALATTLTTWWQYSYSLFFELANSLICSPCPEAEWSCRSLQAPPGLWLYAARDFETLQPRGQQKLYICLVAEIQSRWTAFKSSILGNISNVTPVYTLWKHLCKLSIA